MLCLLLCRSEPKYLLVVCGFLNLLRRRQTTPQVAEAVAKAAAAADAARTAMDGPAPNEGDAKDRPAMRVVRGLFRGPARVVRCCWFLKEKVLSVRGRRNNIRFSFTLYAS